ncbi:Vacuolar protein sorting-associated protein 74 [Aspergillus affinis]|uniref:Vacuolar protein sorting-associated protein 74 n=1 Tax=Aspergillus affinis TaxID=1070780 RepID=UPI0022FE853F|nr:Vacuolar protein sorting-associated protein 74 [Aspergillus affinis]KAI9045781.1 Vacuolar protein sorting-associated protein 74 [Aspergillus affinis]
MFRSAIVRSLRASVPRAIRTPVASQIRSSPIARPAQFAPRFAYQGVRLYSAPAGLDKTEVEGRIVNLLKNFDKVTDASKINGVSHFSNDLGLDSLDTVEVVMAIEEEFSIEIPDKEADAIHSGKFFLLDLFLFHAYTRNRGVVKRGTGNLEDYMLIPLIETVDKAVEYILAQPDAGGLTRRRGGGRATGPDENDDSRVSSPVSRNGSALDNRVPETSFTSTENGHKIAFDPRDISETEERNKQPKLTLMEEVLLLGLKDKQGYLSFWNENISYALRGCIVIELALRGRISMQKDSSRRRFPLADRVIEVIDDTLTGEVLLDEALKMMKSSEKMSVNSWIDLMSGETWNLMKIGYQLKQVRERLAKGLVDKGILRTEKRNFLLFDMATHPVADGGAKDDIHRRVRNICSNRTVILPPNAWLPEDIEFRYLRTISMVCAAYAANVLENALVTMSHEARERAFAQVDELLAEYSQFPFARRPGGSQAIGANLAQAINDEVNSGKDKELQLEIVAACLSVFTRLDSLL